MSASERGGLKAAFTNFKTPNDKEAELKLLGRVIHNEQETPLEVSPAASYPVATTQLPGTGGLTPRPLLQREAVRQLSFRCPVSLAAELRRKGAFNQLEQQQIIVEGIKRVLMELPDPPPGWEL
jgi:hypothetical protein